MSKRRSTRSPASFRTAARLGVQAAEASEYAHEFGVIHRDIKPTNLVLDVRGDLWITDDGLLEGVSLDKEGRTLSVARLGDSSPGLATNSASGRWALGGKSGCCAEQGFDDPVYAAFTPDAKFLAVTLSPSVQLLEVTTWRPLARLQGPDLDPVLLPGFTPDGSRLVVARAAGGARVWDLRRIREQLKALGLDWDLPSLPPEPLSDDVTPVRVEVNLSSFGQTKQR